MIDDEDEKIREMREKEKKNAGEEDNFDDIDLGNFPKFN